MWIKNGFKWILIQLILLLFVSILQGNASVFALGFVCLTVGGIFVAVAFRDSLATSLNIYAIFSLVYFIYAAITDATYVQDSYSDFFFSLDSLKLFTEIDQLAKLDSTSSSISFYFRSFPGFGFSTWYMARFAEYIDSNSVLVLKLHITTISAIIPVILYNIAIKYYDKRKALIVAISFGFLSHLFTYSSLLLRDVHIMFFYCLGFYILLGKWSVKSLLLLMVLTFLVWQFRVQNGIFFLLFILAYLYLPFYKSKNIVITILFSVLLLAILGYSFTTGVLSFENEIEGKLSNYDEYHDNKLQSASGAATAIVSLPLYIRPIVFITLSQLAPFPFYKATYVGTINQYQYLLFPLALTTLYWIFVLIFFLKGLSVRSVRHEILTKLHFAFYIAILLIIVSAMSSPENRRLLPAYPIIYLAASFTYFALTPKARKNIIRASAAVYFGLVILMFLFF